MLSAKLIRSQEMVWKKNAISNSKYMDLLDMAFIIDSRVLKYIERISRYAPWWYYNYDTKLVRMVWQKRSFFSVRQSFWSVSLRIFPLSSIHKLWTLQIQRKRVFKLNETTFAHNNKTVLNRLRISRQKSGWHRIFNF